MSSQSEKTLIRAHHAAIAAARPETVAEKLAEHTHPDWHWRGMHPWHEQHGARAVGAVFWQPLLQAMSNLHRREDIFFAGRNQIDDFQSVWVVSMGHLMGLFDAPFLGLRPTRRIIMLRYAEFHRVAGGEIVETASFCDLLHLMRQAGQYPLPPQTGAHLVQPGPATHDGLLHMSQPEDEGTRTLELICRIIGGINDRTRYPRAEDELAETWHDDMVWWGPEGIGATCTIPRYITQHQHPFRVQMTDRTFNGHIARLAEGAYGGFFGWPNLALTPLGGYMGLPAGLRADRRVVDIYRRDGEKLAENWVFIDMLHFLNMQGLHVLGRLDP